MIRDAVIRLFPPPERRTGAQVRQDIADEFAHHLACLREDLRELGVPEDQLEIQLAQRFGDAAVYARRCAAVTLKERLMLQRINLALLVIITLAFIWVIRDTRVAAAQSAASLTSVNERLNELVTRQRDLAPAPSGAMMAAASVANATVTVKGSTIRPGVYSVPSDGSLTLRRLLIAASFAGFQNTTGTVIVSRFDPATSRNSIVFTLADSAYTQPDGADFVVRAGDIIEAP